MKNGFKIGSNNRLYRGKAIITARGQSSAASAASTALDHMASVAWYIRGGMGKYGIHLMVLMESQRLNVLYPVTISDGKQHVQGLTHNEFAQARLAKTSVSWKVKGSCRPSVISEIYYLVNTGPIEMSFFTFHKRTFFITNAI